MRITIELADFADDDTAEAFLRNMIDEAGEDGLDLSTPDGRMCTTAWVVTP
jgi:hypothetical protein